MEEHCQKCTGTVINKLNINAKKKKKKKKLSGKKKKF